jgi:hypothetical protein
MFRIALVAATAIFCTPASLLGQSVTLNGSLNVAAAEDYATRSFQDPWDMNDRTDLGWFLHGTDQPASQMSNVSFGGGIFSATTGSGANVFLLETGNPEAASIGKVGTNYPINAGVYRLMAIRMNVSGAPQAAFGWYSSTIYQSPSNVGAFNLSSGWRTYLIDMGSLALGGGSSPWGGTVGSLIFYPSGSSVQIDWARLVTVDGSLCRRVSWSGIGGNVDIYLDNDASAGGEWLLAPNVASNTASAGCSAAGSGYTFYAGGFSAGTYYVLVRPAGGGSLTRSSDAYQVNGSPTLTITAPSDEGSSDDFATTRLGNPWDMNAVSDVPQFFNVSNPTITFANTETAAGDSLGSTRILLATSTVPQPGLVGDPILALLWMSPPSIRIDPNLYRLLTVEFGLPDHPRSILTGSVARIVWRVAGQSQQSVSEDIIFNSRAGANVLHKLTVDMADRAVLPIEEGSQIGWVPGNSASPGLDIFRFDVHEFSQPTPFFVKRVKLAAHERVAPGANYTVRWTSSEPTGTVAVYRDTDKNPSNGRTLIGNASVSSTNGSMVWSAPNVGVPTAYYIAVEFSDGQNVNSVYSQWPVVVDPAATTLSTPTGFRIVP